MLEIKAHLVKNHSKFTQNYKIQQNQEKEKNFYNRRKLPYKYSVGLN